MNPENRQDQQDWIPSWFRLTHTVSGEPYIPLPSRDGRPPTYLTAFHNGDEEALTEVLNIEEINNALVSIPKPYKLEHAEFWVKLQRSRSASSPLRFQVIRAGDPEIGKLVGSVSLTPHEEAAGCAKKIKRRPGEVELGYYLHPDFQGKGLMKDAVLGTIAWAATELGVNNVLVFVVEQNTASRKTIESVGKFEQAGEDLEHHPEAKGGGINRLLAWRWEL